MSENPLEPIQEHPAPPAPESYEPESLADLSAPAAPDADEDTGDLTEAVTAADQDATDEAIDQVEATAEIPCQEGTAEIPVAPAQPSDELPGLQPMVEPPQAPKAIGTSQVLRHRTPPATVGAFSELLDFGMTANLNRVAELVLMIRTMIKRAKQAAADGEQYKFDGRLALRAARLYVSITPDQRDDVLMNKIDNLLANVGLLAEFDAMVTSDQPPRFMHDLNAPAPQHFIKAGFNVDRLRELLGLARTVFDIVERFKSQ